MRVLGTIIAASCLASSLACQETKDVAQKPTAGSDSATSNAELAGAGPIFFANIEGRPLQFKFGKAYATSDSLHFVLSTEKTPCSLVHGTDEAYRIRFDLTPGPGGRFFAGKPTGVGATFESRHTRLAITVADPYLVTVAVEPFVLKGGAHVRGHLEFDVKFVKTKIDRTKQAYQSKGIGYFDVEICDDSQVLKGLSGQPEEVPEGEVTGTFAGDKFGFKTAIANVWHDSDNAQDYVDSIVFFPTGSVTCENQWDQREKLDLFMIRSIGGAGRRQRFVGSPQPASALFSIPRSTVDVNGATGSFRFFGGGAERAWVRFEKLEFKSGGSVIGTVYADSRPGSKSEETGKIGGRFKAKVCTTD
jgi:hypothetical protein